MIETDSRYKDIESVLNVQPVKKSMKFKIIAVILIVLLLAGGAGAGIYFLEFNGSNEDKNGSSSSKPLEGNTDKETEDGTNKIEDKSENIIVVDNEEIAMKDQGKNVEESDLVMIESQEQTINGGVQDSNIDKSQKSVQEDMKDNERYSEKDEEGQINTDNQKYLEEITLQISPDLDIKQQTQEQQASEDQHIHHDLDGEVQQRGDKITGEDDEIQEREREIAQIVKNIQLLFNEVVAWVNGVLNNIKDF